MRISDWSSDVCSSDLGHTCAHRRRGRHDGARGDDPRVPGPHRSTVDRRLACHFDLCPRQSGRTDESFGGATTELPDAAAEIGRAPVWTPVTTAPLVCRLPLDKKKPYYPQTTLHHM